MIEKQSCTSAPCMSRGFRFAIPNAFSAALRAVLKSRRILLLQREIIGRVSETEQIAATSIYRRPMFDRRYLPETRHERRRAIGDLRAIGNFQGRRDARFLSETCDAQS